jgi:glutathione S-transferase
MTTSDKPIYFYSPGACSFGGIVVSEWLGLPYELCRVDSKLRSSDAYKEINPLGKVPALKVGQHLLAENAAILPYLAWQKPEAGLMPDAHDFQYNVMSQWLSYLSSIFHIAFSPLFAPGAYIDDAKEFDRIKAVGIVNVKKKYAFMEQHFAENERMLGKQKTILDPYFYGMARWGNNFFSIEKEFPNVARFMKLMEQDKAVQFALGIEKEEAVTSPSGAFQGHIALDKVV